MRGSSLFKPYLLLGLIGLLLCSCNNTTPEHSKITPVLEAPSAPISKQFEEGLNKGLDLNFNSFSLNIPGKEGKGDNTLSLADEGHGYVRLDGLSLHQLTFGMAATLSYNNQVERSFGLSLEDDEIFVGLSWPGENNGIRLKSKLEPSQVEAITSQDSSTRGIEYYEYGLFDYFLYSLFDAWNLPAISLTSPKHGGITIDGDKIKASFDQIEEIEPGYFRYDLPLGEKTLSFGLIANSSAVLSGIDFPLKGESPYQSEDGLEISFSASISPATTIKNLTPEDPESYVEISSSIDLIKDVGDYVSSKRFGIDASFNIYHHEEAVEGSSTAFSRDAVTENATLSLSADASFEGGTFEKVFGEAALSMNGNQEKVSLLLQEETEDTKAYIALNESVMKASTGMSTLSSLATTLKEALGMEGVQNDTIKNLIAGVVASMDSITNAIDAVTGSAIYDVIDSGQYHTAVEAISALRVSQNKLLVTVDLDKLNGTGFQAKMVGKVSATLDATDSSTSLLSIDLDQVGIVTTNSPNLTFTLDGLLTLRPFSNTKIDALDLSSYQEMAHLPSWDEYIAEAAGTKESPNTQIQANISGYISKKGSDNHSNIRQSVSSWDGTKNLNEQGMLFNGSLGFDLYNKIGTGKVIFTDRKENYINDHTLAIDVTGAPLEASSDEEETNWTNGDFSGNDTNAGGMMLFSYSSMNTIQAKNGYNTSTNRNYSPTDPTNKNGLNGRFSIHSMNGVLDALTELLTSTDPRFKRLTSAFTDLKTKTTFGAVMKGQYLEVVSSGILSSVDINNVTNVDTFVLKPSLIKENIPTSLRITYGEDHIVEGNVKKGLPKYIELYMPSLSSSEGSEIYVKIELTKTSLSRASDFNWGENPSISSFTSYSCLKQLIDFLLGTITLGVTNSSTLTTYHISGNVVLSIVGIKTTITINLVVYLDGTEIKMVGAIYTPKITLVNDGNTYVNLFYENDGDNQTGGDLFFRRYVHESNTITSDDLSESYKRVTGDNFMDNILKWLLNYILGMKSSLTSNLDDISSDRALHGEDIVKGITSSGNTTNPSWRLTIGMEGLTGTSILTDFVINISGKTATYSGYSKKSLYSASGSFGLSLIGIQAATASFNLSISNIASSGAYTNAWTSSSHKVNMYSYSKYTTGSWIFKTTHYNINSNAMTASNAMYNSTYGKTNSNSHYKNTGYSVTP